MEWINQIWVWILGAVGGLTVGGIITAICVAFIKGKIAKMIAKVNFEKIEEKAVNKGLEKIKGVTFKHEIQPLVQSEMVKVNENAVKGLKNELKEIKAQYTHLVLINEKLAAYFDNSIVSEAKKAELHEAIEDAKETPLYVESVVLEEKLKEEYKPQQKAKKTEEFIVER